MAQEQRRRAQTGITKLVRAVEELREDFRGWTLDNAFVHWFLSAFLVADRDTASKCVTGAPHDKGVDGVLVSDDTQSVFVIQGKLHQGERPPAENRSDVISFADIARKLFGTSVDRKPFFDRMNSNARHKLEGAIERLNRGYRLELLYVTTGFLSASRRAEATAEVAQAPGQASIQLFDREDVLRLYDDYEGGAAPPVPYLNLRVDTRGTIDSAGIVQRFDKASGIESWIFPMKGSDVGALYGQAGDRLFARNIRGFLGNSQINRGMVETLRTNPQNFWYFNNGITLVCDKALKTSERGQTYIHTKNPQVINGQQTTRTLHLEPQPNATVLVRVISIPRTGTESPRKFESFVSNVVAATNWQNAIRASDLRANDAAQVALERDFRKLGYQYLRKRQTKTEARRILGDHIQYQVKKEELAQAVAACEFDPKIVRSGIEGLFDLEGGYYDRIFDGRSIHEYLAIFWLNRAVKHGGRGHRLKPYARWFVMHYMWDQLGPWLRRKTHAIQFRDDSERNARIPPLDGAITQIYLAALEFWRKHRGQGEDEMEIGTFYYRAGQHKEFVRYLARSGSLRRKRAATLLGVLKKIITQELAAEA